MNMIDVTIDFETCSLSANAAILQLAAVAWDRNFSKQPFIDNDNSRFDAHIDLASCVALNLDFDQSTISFWASQPKSIQDSVLRPGSCLPIEVALKKFIEWLHCISAECGEVRLWSQGSDFDIAILRNVFNKAYSKYPELFDRKLDQVVRYTSFRDARTFILEMGSMLFFDGNNVSQKEIYGKIPKMEGDEHKHNALYDALQTSWNVWYIIKQFRMLLSKTD